MIVGDYAAPQTIEEACALIAAGDARPLAGGNALLLEPSRRQLAGTKLVDLRRIAGLSSITDQDGGLRIGAMATLAALAAAAGDRYPALTEAIQSIGDAQVRNRATVGGNLAERDPGNDLPPVVTVLDAQVQVQGPSGSRVISPDDLTYGGWRKGELITGVILPAPAARTGSAYEKIKHPATLYALCAAAASVTLNADGTVSGCSVAVAGAADAPTKLSAIGRALEGKRVDDATLEAAADRIGELRWRGDHFASAEYRRHLTRVLVQRVLAKAAARAS
jgi:aerobic carbon-monoxide dehydrogenase medium subunit